MNISIEVSGTLNFNEVELKEMTNILNKCRKEEKQIPTEVENYFKKLGCPIDIVPAPGDTWKPLVGIPFKEPYGSISQGIDIDTKDIPKAVETIEIRLKI